MYKKLFLIIIPIIIAISLNSCVVAAVLIGTAVVAGGTVYYINGNYIIKVPRDIRSVYNATIKTIQMNSQYTLISQTYHTKNATIKASQKGESISVDLSNVDSHSTEIKIRIGALGDEKKSADLANSITKNIT
ncbi:MULTISPECIES: DUF3568 family protein [Francisella]|uniref:DUF3568 domain-containing protein n=1 Tax=Francisella opportunistica TaxID=2016517 RepID=A0A345JTF9_9GAMM|nr:MULTISPECIES: DUF3568 family protein [Francisella]APC92402.1 hypothetical protein BBG19_1676 [Francisella sp. MA067296]AXH30605.1 DUF3568 domain-containing protein [Francisella opportunistica]AXH32246.1 DUF3568 domain-containing protein [Francisella opportunistica]AXH33895.1 DUF3568 domain-containing protein [Francisella opportunistica]